MDQLLYVFYMLILLALLKILYNMKLNEDEINNRPFIPSTINIEIQNSNEI